MIVQLLWRAVACCGVCMHVLLCTWCVVCSVLQSLFVYMHVPLRVLCVRL